MQKSKSTPNFFKRHFNGIAMAAVALIPTIYTTLFLGSMWDPYGNVDKLPVAVVNEDQPVEYEDKTLDIGNSLVEKLNENKQMDFCFVDKEDAKNGLIDGTYYMVITIPSDFSSNASTLMDDEPKKMQLLYETNPGTNYIASKMSESALTKIEKEISASVTQEYTETIFEQMGTLGDGISEAADGASQISDGVVKLKDGNTLITDNLELLADSSLTFVDGAKTLEDGIKTYTSGVSEVNSGAKTLSDGMNELSSGTGSLTSGVTALNDGSGTLAGGINSYTDGVTAAYNGAQTLSGSSSQLQNGVASLTSGAVQLQNGSAAMTAGLQTLSDSLRGSLSADNMTQIEQLSSGLTQLKQGIDSLNTTLQSTELPDTSGLVQTLTESLTSIGTKAQDAGTQLQTMQSSVSAMTQTEAFQSLDPAFQQELLNCFSVPMTALAGDISEIGTQVTTLSTVLQSMDLSSSAGAISQLKTGVGTLAAGADQAIPGAQQAIANLSGGLQSVQQAVDGQLLPGSQSISSGLNQLISGSNTLENGVADYTGGVSSLTSGLNTLYQNNSSLVNGAASLNSGTKTLANSIPTLTDAVSQLKNGAAQLADGTAELNSNNSKLTDGAAQLTDGAVQIQDGAAQLADGSVEVGDGLTELLDGSDTLESALTVGADEINSIQADDLTFEMFASPVSSEETFAAEVESNGNAMAAYMMAVGLWVAGLAFCVILSPHEQKIKGRNAVSAWAKQLGLLWIMAVAQAFLMVFALKLFNGFSPENLLRTLMIACLASIAFITLEYCINFFLGVIGSFILLVFMVLQLSGCAGTYPLELSDKFYQLINPFMPFTYTVHGFRSGIASGQSVAVDCIVLVMIAIVFAGLLFAGFRTRLKNQQENNDTDTNTAVSDTPVCA